jgi:hypothetical protein
MTNDLHRALDSVADLPTPDFVTRLAREIENEMSSTTAARVPVSEDLDLQETPAELDRHAPRVWRRTTAVLAAAAVIAVAVALSSPFGRDAAIRTGTTATFAPAVTATSTPTPSPTLVEPTTANDPSPLTVASTPAEWEALPPAPLRRREQQLVIAMGTEVLVAGGANREVRIFEGAVFDGNSWRTIPSAPSVLTDSAPAVWTGSAVVALGDDGQVVSFTPGTDQWKVVSKEAATPRTGATAVWSGTEFLVAGGTDPRITATANEASPLLEAAAFNPATRRWRTLPAPPGADPLLGPSAWSGTEWIRAAAAPINGQLAATKVGAFDPAANQWRMLPDVPGQVSAIAEVGSAVAAYSQESFGVTHFKLKGEAWAYDSAVPSFEQSTTIRNAYVVKGVELASGYLTLTYRQAGGGWGWIPNPISLAGDERYVETSDGNLIAYASGKATRLRKISDPTAGMPQCRGRDFSTNIEAGADEATRVLINAGPACTLNQADERNLQFQVGVDWSNPVEDRRLTRGGLGYVVEPEGRLTVNFANVEGEAYPRSCVSTPPTTSPIYAARFTLSSTGDPVELKVTVPTGCVALTISVAPALPPAPPTTTTSIVRPVPTDRWETLPDFPGESAYKPLVVALGNEVLVVGGYGPLRSDQVPKKAGAIFDGQKWRTIPDAPAPLAREMSAVWTGSIALVVSADGMILAFTPGSDSWEVIGKAPQPNRIGAQVVWTGDEMLMASGGLPEITELEGGTNVIEEAVAYRPATGTWRALPQPPTADRLTGKSVWTGNEWVRTVGFTEGKFDGFGSIAAFDPKSNRWRELPPLDVVEPPTAILMEGDALVVYTSTERRRLAGETWVGVGAIPPFSGYGTSTGGAWFVGGQAIRAGYDNYNNFETLDTNGMWQPLGDPFPSYWVDSVVTTADDRLIAIGGGRAARLRTP